MSNEVDFSDVQGILRFGYRRLTEAYFLLLSIRDPQAACAWLSSAPVSNAVAIDSTPVTALQIAFTLQGLQALGLSDDLLSGFSIEFRAGMDHPARARLLGDVGQNAPEHWNWGTGAAQPHVLMMLYAQPGHLGGLRQTLQTDAWNAAFGEIACLDTSDLGGFEPFGFMDSLSQPVLDWQRHKDVSREQLAYSNIASLGEFVLGYPNEYGRYTGRPMLTAQDGPASILPFAPEQPGARDFGQNGCYLVLRTLEQDVRGFWRFADAAASGNSEERDALAASMVGRMRDGTPITPTTQTSIPGVPSSEAAANQFTFDADPQGTRCPFGAHIRRANPRNADLPTPPAYGVEKALRVVGLGAKDLHSDAKASTRFHRLLRRGREYGPRLTPEDALGATPDNTPRGIHFICLVGNIARQFEFIQSAWLMASKFDTMTDESDPLLGNREPIPGGITDTFSRPQADGLRKRCTHLPQFVRVKGGAYFFMPSLSALRYIATLRNPLA